MVLKHMESVPFLHMIHNSSLRSIMSQERCILDLSSHEPAHKKLWTRMEFSQRTLSRQIHTASPLDVQVNSWNAFNGTQSQLAAHHQEESQTILSRWNQM